MTVDKITENKLTIQNNSRILNNNLNMNLCKMTMYKMTEDKITIN